MEQLDAVAKDAANQYEEDCADYGARGHFVDGWKAAMKVRDADHCTPEERAVIDTALRYRNHMREKYHYIAVEYLFSSMDSEDGRLCTAVIEAADALVARARRGEVE